MKHIKDFKKLIFTVLLACCVMVWGTVTSSFAISYQDGTYQVPVSLSGGSMGHNDVVSPCTVTVSGGVPYATLVFKRVTAPWHAPNYEWLRTSMGTVYPVVNEGNYSNTFNQVPLPGLGSVPITTLSTAMSEPHEISYTLYFDAGSIPVIDNSGQPEQGNTAVNQATNKSDKKNDKQSDKKDKEKKDDKDTKENTSSKNEKDKDKKNKDGDKKSKEKNESKNIEKSDNQNKNSETKIIVYAALAISTLLIAAGCVFFLVKGAKNVGIRKKK